MKIKFPVYGDKYLLFYCTDNIMCVNAELENPFFTKLKYPTNYVKSENINSKDILYTTIPLKLKNYD